MLRALSGSETEALGGRLRLTGGPEGPGGVLELPAPACDAICSSDSDHDTLLELCALGQDAGFEVAPERDQEFARERHDSDLA